MSVDRVAELIEPCCRAICRDKYEYEDRKQRYESGKYVYDKDGKTSPNWKKYEAVVRTVLQRAISDWHWRDVGLEPNGLEAWSKLHQARDALANAADAEEILVLLDQLADAEKDAERWRLVRNNRGTGVRLIIWSPDKHHELQVMFPSQTLCDIYVDAALNPAREDVK